MTGAQQQARYRDRLRRLGLVSVVVVIPAGAVLQLLAEAMRASPHLRPGPVRDPHSGKLMSARRVLSDRG